MITQKTLERRLNALLESLGSDEAQTEALKAIVADTDRGANHKYSLLRTSYRDLEANDLLIDLCNERLKILSRYKQMTIFDALNQCAGGAA